MGVGAFYHRTEPEPFLFLLLPIEFRHNPCSSCREEAVNASANTSKNLGQSSL